MTTEEYAAKVRPKVFKAIFIAFIAVAAVFAANYVFMTFFFD